MAIDIARLQKSSDLLESMKYGVDFSHFDYPLRASQAANDDNDDI
jgi:hypothetical protein